MAIALEVMGGGTCSGTRGAGDRAGGVASTRFSPRAAQGARRRASQVSMARIVRRQRRAAQLAVRASSSSGTYEDGTQEGGTAFPDDLAVPTRCMAQLSGSGGATMQKSKLTTHQEVRIHQPSTADAGGGGDIGKRIFNGGGGGGDDSDDDEYHDFDDDDENDLKKVGLFALRDAIPEIFDRVTIDCLLSEWYKTVVTLPAGLRMAVEMSGISTAQLVRFLSMDYRPKVTRALTRNLPGNSSRLLVGRLMADPAFHFKLLLEQAITVSGSLAFEAKHRGKRFGKEWRHVVANTAALCAATAATSWLTAPCRAFGSTHRHPWQKALSGLPNHVFEKSGPLRRYTLADRAAGGAFKAAQLGAVGLASGVLALGLNRAACLAESEECKPLPGSEPKSPVFGSPVLGLGAHMLLASHFRYQMLGGVDRWLAQHCGHLGAVIGGTTATRLVTGTLAEGSRASLQGIKIFAKDASAGKKQRRGRGKKQSAGRYTKSAAFTATQAAVKARAL